MVFVATTRFCEHLTPCQCILVFLSMGFVIVLLKLARSSLLNKYYKLCFFKRIWKYIKTIFDSSLLNIFTLMYLLDMVHEKQTFSGALKFLLLEPGCTSQKPQKVFGPEKPFVKI